VTPDVGRAGDSIVLWRRSSLSLLPAVAIPSFPLRGEKAPLFSPKTICTLAYAGTARRADRLRVASTHPLLLLRPAPSRASFSLRAGARGVFFFSVWSATSSPGLPFASALASPERLEVSVCRSQLRFPPFFSKRSRAILFFLLHP